MGKDINERDGNFHPRLPDRARIHSRTVQRYVANDKQRERMSLPGTRQLRSEEEDQDTYRIRRRLLSVTH